MTERLDALKEAYGFQAWRGRNTLGHDLLVRGFFVSGWQVPGWSPLRRSVLSGTGVRQDTTYLSDRPQLSDRGMTVTVFECASRAAAHEHMIVLLGDFQGPLVEREDGPLGDVAFVVPGDNLAMFARGNEVVVVRRAEREPVPVRETAQRLDDVLTGTASPAQARVHPELKVLRVAPADASGRARVEVGTGDPLDRPTWLRVSAPGELWMEGEQVFVRAGKTGGALAVTVFNENGGTAEARATLSDVP